MRQIRFITARVGIAVASMLVMLGVLAAPALAHIVPESAYTHRVATTAGGSGASVAALVAAAIVFAGIAAIAVYASHSRPRQRRSGRTPDAAAPIGG